MCSTFLETSDVSYLWARQAKGVAVLLGCATPLAVWLFYLISHKYRLISNGQNCILGFKILLGTLLLRRVLVKSKRDRVVSRVVNTQFPLLICLRTGILLVLTYYIRASQKGLFLWNSFFRVGHNFFPLFRSKALQKSKNWKFLWIFSPCRSPSKFYYITLVCEMELGRKFKFFPIFHYKTMLFSFESEFSVKNVIFWGTSSWCSSKIKKVEAYE